MLFRTVFILTFVCFFAASVSAEPQLNVQLDRSVLYEGEAFFYQLTVSDTSPLNENITPDTSAWTDFNVQLIGKQALQRGGGSFTMIFNGQTIRDDRTAMTYSTQFNYVLVPKRTGTQTIPLPQVAVNGKTLQPQSFSVGEGERQILADYSIVVQILGAEEQDIVFLSIETNRNRLYPLQPLEVTLVIQIKGLPDRYADSDPLTVPRQPWQPPHLQIPWAEEDPKGFLSNQKLESWLTGFLLRMQRGGFAINDYVGNRDLFSFSAAPLLFSNTPQKVQRPDAQGNETIYWEYRFTRTLIPQEFGNHSFGPVTLKGTLPIIDANAPDRISWKKIYAIAKPVAVAVADVPQANRPADYIGAFGSFRWEANLAPKQARVGDPLTLTLRLLGEGSTMNVRPIDLSANSDVTGNFRIHMPPTEEFDEQSCTLTYTIRPLAAGSIEFPPIPISVFDVHAEKFVPLRSFPIPLDIAESEVVESATLFGNIPNDADEEPSAEEGLFANATVLLDMLRSITWIQWIIAISLLAWGYAMITLTLFLVRSRRLNPQQRRRRGALNRAKSRLASISSVLRMEDSANLVEISGELQGVFFGYIADKTDGIEQGMTTDEACQQLVENQVPEALVEAVRALLESLDAVKYGKMDVPALDERTTAAGTLVQQLDNNKAFSPYNFPP